MMSTLTVNHCVICYSAGHSSGWAESGDICQRFFVLVGRYLDLGNDDSVNSNLEETNQPSFTGQVCDKCSPLIESFSDTYEHWKKLQREMNSRLEQIEEVMLNADDETNAEFEGARQCLREKLVHSGNTIEAFIRFRRKLKRRVVRKLDPLRRAVIRHPAEVVATGLGNETDQEMKTEPVEDAELYLPPPGSSCSMDDEDDEGDDELYSPPSGSPTSTDVGDDDDDEEEEEDDDDERMISAPIGGEPKHLETLVKPAKMKGPARGTEVSERKNSGGNIYKCKFCGRKFSRRYTRNAHEKRQSCVRREMRKNTLFPCTFCIKTFSARHYLSSHMRIHTREKPYNCHYPECGASFNHTVSLRSHMLRHTGEKPYSCTQCGRQFRQLCQLKAHGLVHQKYRTILHCATCGKTFLGERSLRRHEVQFHGSAYQERNHSNTGKEDANFENSGDEVPGNTAGNTVEAGAVPKPKLEVLRKRKQQLSVLKEELATNLETNADASAGLTTAKAGTGSPSVPSRSDGIQSIAPTTTIKTSVQMQRPYFYLKICSYCNKSCESPSGLQRHLLSHTKEKPYKCTYCERTFGYKLSQMAHEDSVHLNKKPFKCQFCSQHFATKKVMEDHQRKHTGEKPYKCQQCGKRFRLYAVCYSHQKGQACIPNELRKNRIERTVEDLWICKLCGKSLVSASSLRHHEKVTCPMGKPREKTHECPICLKKFVELAVLRNHQRLHSEKLHKCEICEKKFHLLSQLKSHEILHSGVKAFTCECCGKSFAQRETLRVHQLIHVDDAKKPLKCAYCNKRFNSSFLCKQHERTHTGEKPFSCDLCGRSFGLKANLKAHEALHNPEHKPFSCEFCDKKFARKCYLRDHMKRLHKEEFEQSGIKGGLQV